MATKPKITQNIFEQNHISFRDVKDSQAWFSDKTKEMGTVTPNKVMMGNAGQNMTHVLTPGKLYMFYYDPKMKETLPYYDTFPLVLPFARDSNTFTGLNLHYLDYQTRFQLFKALLKITGAGRLNAKTKLEYSWKLVKSVAQLAPAQACIKMYLFDHLRSPFLEVPPKEWATACMLPVHRFVGSSASSVWKDSNRKFK
jgi:hypothetical protein